MRLEELRVALRPRSPWEAVELGTALVRANARAIWIPWLLVSAPLFAALNAIAWGLNAIPIAGLVLWWTKPVFDRIPLYVVSRAVFGATPAVSETLAAQARWGWRPMLHYLTWRRFGMARSLFLPIDLLEGTDPQRVGERRRALGGALRGHATLLTLACLNFEIALSLAAVALALMFVPLEFLSESARAAWMLMAQSPPRWAQVASNALAWMGTTLIEPFYVGAGFGLYLNRRVQIEAWDLDIAFRRFRTRARAAVVATMLGVALLSSQSWPARAQADTRAPVEPTTPVSAAHAPAQAQPAQRALDKHALDKRAPGKPTSATTLPQIFGDEHADWTTFRKAVQRAYANPLLSPREKRSTWERRKPVRPQPVNGIPWLSKLIAFLGSYGLWLLLGALVVALAATSRRWVPWLGGAMAMPIARRDVANETLSPAPALPVDIAAAVRALWREGHRRGALALLYRANVEAMSLRAGTALVPGATEAECLRIARLMPDAADRETFSGVVRMWQHAAYAQRLPKGEEFEAMLERSARGFGWPQ
ncbi:MAG: DUF4129 domain-containing protein [Luteimonas sp.]